MARISVHLVSWNSAKVLPEAIGSLKAQTFKDWSLTVVDNASKDGTVELVRKKIPEATVLRNFKNLGFSHAHNQAIQMARQKWSRDNREGSESEERYVLLMNPDIIMVPDFLEKLIAYADGKSAIGSFGGKLLKVLPRLEEHEDPRFTEIIDSTGMRVRLNRRVTERGAGEKDEGQYDDSEEVFGISGALALYRIEALDSAALGDGEILDEIFFAYKEDVDLAWRLRLLGWGAAYVPEAVSYHYRGAGLPEKAGFFKTMKRRRARSTQVNRYSTRNHLLMLAKNDDFVNGLIHAPYIWSYELVKFLMTALTTPRVLVAYLDIFRFLPKMWRKRAFTMNQRKSSSSDIRKWIGRKG
jgi:GT2 family glycosyltransferase